MPVVAKYDGMPLTATVGIEVRFEAAHFLPRVPKEHKCHKLHGHNYVVQLEVSGATDPMCGWLVDFADIEQIAQECAARLDHSLLNDRIENPTAEVIAWLFRDAVVRGVSGYEVRVTVCETPGKWVSVP